MYEYSTLHVVAKLGKKGKKVKKYTLSLEYDYRYYSYFDARKRQYDLRREINGQNDCLVLVDDDSYRLPPLQMAFLSALSVFFGTTDIHVGDNYIIEGYCDTCSIGRMYGRDIRIENITRNYPSNWK